MKSGGSVVLKQYLIVKIMLQASSPGDPEARVPFCICLRRVVVLGSYLTGGFPGSVLAVEFVGPANPFNSVCCRTLCGVVYTPAYDS